MRISGAAESQKSPHGRRRCCRRKQLAICDQRAAAEVLTRLIVESSMSFPFGRSESGLQPISGHLSSGIGRQVAESVAGGWRVELCSHEMAAACPLHQQHRRRHQLRAPN
jgi:hypothetical protein